MNDTEIEISGRQSSHYTRVVRMFAAELCQAYRFTPIYKLMSREPGDFASNPALRLPILRVDGEAVFGSHNICRVLARRSGREHRVFWPEQAETALLMNAHEILANAMAGEVEVVVHERVEKRAPDDASRKRREGLVNSLQWLDGHVEEVRAALPERDLSMFEVGLFCLVSHLPFRNPMDLSGMPRLTGFEAVFGERDSARSTPYRFDAPGQAAQSSGGT